jgi:hypothetical protein
MPIGSVYNLPQGQWDGNNFQFPLAQRQPRLPFQMALDPFAVPQPQPMQTSGVAVPAYVTEGASHNRGPGQAGLGYGAPDIGYQKGEATAEMSTTATDKWGDVVKGALAGAIPGFGAFSHTLTGQTPLGYIGQQLSDLFSNTPNPANATPSQSLSYGPSEASGFADYGTANAPDPNAPGVGTSQVGQANDPFGGGTGLGQGGGDTGSAK